MKNKLILCLLALLSWLAVPGLVSGGEVVPAASTWKYFIGTQEPSTPTAAWRTVGFDDSAWTDGQAPLGYGEADLNTVLRTSGTAPTYTTVYLRKKFNVANLAAISQVTASLRVDDGAVIWINGIELGRANVGAGELAFNAVATLAEETRELTITTNNSVLVAGENVVTVLALNANTTSSDLTIDATVTTFVDDQGPIIVATDPAQNSTVNELTFIDVVFDESVTGVNASDLTINGVAATSVSVISPREYQFFFPQPPTGAVSVAFIAGHGIMDMAVNPNPFAGGSWTYSLDPNAAVSSLIISEFMADNENGIKDEDGNRTDWIEIFNPGPTDASLNGYYLTDTPTNLTKWRFPDVPLAVNRYLLVYASEKDRTNNAAPLHTNFKLGKNPGGYLALVNPQGQVVSVFLNYPAQVADVSYGRDRLDPDLLGYFTGPTPGAQNSASGTGFAPEPVFSLESGVYTNDSLSLTITATPSAGTTIRYTTDGSEPTNATSGTLYSGPIAVTGNLIIKARVFQNGVWPSAVKARNFILLDPTTRNFSSDLPLVVITTPGGIPASVIAGGARRRGTVAVIDTFRGRAALTSKTDYLGPAQFETFGQTSEGFAKKPHNIEINDEYGNDKSASLLGMPAEADWKMRNPFSDKCLMNDFLAYELFEEMGNYQCRRRFVEVFINTAAGTKLSYANYYGVLVLLEKIEIDKNRVDIPSLTAANTNEPSITGGYMFKRDKASAGDLDFTTAAGTAFKMHEPKPKELAGGVNNPQVQWLRKYIGLYETAVNAADWLTRTGTNHYSNYIDVDSFVDSHWIVEFPKQIDGYRISNYFSKDRGGKIKNSPIWDWNLSFGNADYLEGGKTNGWYYTQLGAGDHVFLRRLVGDGTAASGDPDFKQKVVDRWTVLRTNVMNGERLLKRIDEIAAQLSESAVRNYAKYTGLLGVYTWPNPNGPPNWDMDYVRPTNYSGIISEMKKWTWGRWLWVDNQFVRAPELSNAGGPIPAGFNLAIAAPAGTIYYTLDGTDPRLPGGNVSPTALTYSGPITLNANARVFARAKSATAAWSGTTWSGPAIGTYVVSTPKLIISELMYNPLGNPPGDTNDNDNFEYLEIKNTGTTPLNVNRFRVRGGLDFEFPNATLAAGESAVIVANTAAFQSRYGTGRRILGQYTDRLDNAGEHLVLEGSLREPILDFTYSDGWYPVTDGLGFSLVVASDSQAASEYDLASGWRASSALNGSPSQSEPAAPAFPQVVINEALTHTDPPLIDAIELHNAGPSDANVGDWYLSDDRQSPKKYRIPAGTIIPAGGYLVVYETNFNAGSTAFSLSSLGDEVYVFSGDAAGNLTGYRHGFDFGPQRNGVTFGRHIISDGNDHFVAQASPTLGAANSGPLVGPVVISEIHYHPVDVAANGGFWNNTEDEYIELHNVSDTTVQLNLGNPTNCWRLRDAVEYSFPAGASIAPNGFIIVASVNTANAAELAAFRSRNGIAAGVPVFGPFTGALDNAGDSVELVRPDVPEPTEVPYVLADKVRYSNVTPWPAGADGVGASLQRLSMATYGNDAANWRALARTPGTPTSTGTLPVITQHPQSTTVIETYSATFSVTAEGTPPLQYQWQFKANGLNEDWQPLFGATSSILILNNVQTSQAGKYRCFVLNGGGIEVSTEASLTVRVQARVLQHPANVSIRGSTNNADYGSTTNRSANFSVAASSTSGLTYQWRFNGAPIAGATANVLTVNNVTLANDGYYDCAITDDVSTIYSNPARLAVLITPTIVFGPVPQFVAAGQPVTVSVAIRGNPEPFMYQWRSNSVTIGTIVSESRTNVFTIPATSISTNPGTVNYRVAITNAAQTSFGTVNSVLFPITILADADRDGIPDAYETANGLNPNSSADAALDKDGDGMTNGEEHIAGTDPSDNTSYLKVDTSVAPGTASILFQAVSNRVYTVEYTDILPSGAWNALSTVPARSSNRPETVLDSAWTTNRFYRLVVPGQP